METFSTRKVIYNISSGNAEVNLDGVNRVSEYATIDYSLGELPDEEKDTNLDQRKGKTMMTPFPKSLQDKNIMKICVMTTMVLAFVISVGIIVSLLVTSKSDSDDCTSSHCGNGTCIDSINNYTCACNPGFTGTRCERDIDECTSSPCGNGTCIDGINNYTCTCTPGFTGKSCERVLTDCYDLYHFAGQIFDGVYTIVTWETHQNIQVYCDMTTYEGGWTVFQYRFNGSWDFYRNFSEYKHGFGNLKSEFWLGLNYIQEISSQGQTDLRIILESANGTRAFEQFENFYLSPGPDFTLHLGRTTDSSHISDTHSFGPFHNGGNFSTYDRDLDTNTGNCAESHKGGWWYKYCFVANLNGIYNSTMYYHSFIIDHSLQMSKMMFRRT